MSNSLYPLLEAGGANICNSACSESGNCCDTNSCIVDIVDQGDLIKWSYITKAYDHDQDLCFAFSSQSDAIDKTLNMTSTRNIAASDSVPFSALGAKNFLTTHGHGQQLLETEVSTKKGQQNNTANNLSSTSYTHQFVNDKTNNNPSVNLTWLLSSELNSPTKTTNTTNTNSNKSSINSSTFIHRLPLQLTHSEQHQELIQRQPYLVNGANFATETNPPKLSQPFLPTSTNMTFTHYPVATLQQQHHLIQPNVVNHCNYRNGNVRVDNIASAHVPITLRQGQVQPLLTLEEKLFDWIVEIHKNIVPPYKRSGKKSMLLIPLTTYNYYFRDERDNIINNMNDEGDPLPSPVSQFTLSKMQALLYQRWYVDPVKKKRIHRKTHGLMDFKTLSKVISERWKELDKFKRNFYSTIAKYDDIYYHEQLEIIKAPNSSF